MAPQQEIVGAQAPVTERIAQQQPRPQQDAQAERAKATFDVTKLAAYVNDGSKNIEKRRKLAAELERLPWSNKDRRYFLNREEEYVGGLRAATQIWLRMSGGKMSVEDALLMRSMVDWPGGLELHIGMFIPTITGQGSDEQQERLLPLCNTLQIIGTYAQTELGHGTFVRGLETTATYHAPTQQFIIHSPTQTSTKWWPGGLGKTATHAVVIARLFVGGKDHGPHSFVVQLRSLETHKCLEGVQIGDIGPKFGYNGVDNGFLRFDHVLVGRDAMLSRFSQVTPEGKYVPPPKDNQKATYSTMLFVRSDIVAHAARYLAKATCIATRYCCVRRQTAPTPGARELQVIDYENTAATLLPLIAASYVVRAMGQSLWGAYKAFERSRAAGNFDALPELHALSAGLKAVVTTTTADGIEACRRTCGGHGFSLLSGLPTLFASYVQNVTWEGDNNVLLLQTARYILKNALGLAANPAAPLPPRLSYLAGKQRRISVGTDGWLDAAFALRCKWLVEVAVRRVSQHPEAGGRVRFEGAPWNSNTTALIAAGAAHCHAAMLEGYFGGLGEASAGAGLGEQERQALERMGRLWAVCEVERNLGEFILSGGVSTDEAPKVAELKRQLLREARPDAISLVDAWAFTDYELNSCIGREDGAVYDALLRAARDSPLNATDEGPAWEAVLKPVIGQLRAKL